MSQSEGPTLSILICSFNVREHVERCLASLYDRPQGVSFEVVLVDNDSVDGTVEAVRERYPAVRIVANRANVGFTQANNQALARARGQYVLFLNPDTEVGAGTLRRCVQALRGEPEIGMVGCRLLYPDGNIQYSCARRAYRLGDLLLESCYLHRFLPHHPVFGRQLLGHWDHRDSRDVEGISGAFMMMPRALAEQLGGMATEVFMYHEDMDLCLRVRQAGYRIRYLADVETVHHVGQSTVRSWAEPAWSLLELEANSRLIRQIQGPAAAVAARAAYLVRSIVRLGVSLVGMIVPGRNALRERYPNVFTPRRHALQLVWSVSPRLVRHRVPRAPSLDEVPEPVEYPGREGRRVNAT